MFNNLRELILSMPDEKQCKQYLAQQRWPDGKVICHYCGGSNIYRIKERDRFKCGNPDCYKKFSVTVGTIFEASKIPLLKWFTAIYLFTAHKKGISSYQLGKDIGVSQKCSWFMLHRIREMMRPKENVLLDNIVEVDEVYIGGKVSNMHKSKRKMLRDTGMTMQTKTMVMGMIERSGNLKLIPIGKSNNLGAIQPAILTNVDKDAVIITDSLGSYVGIDKTFAGHEVVRHDAHEFVRDSTIHTNTIEGAFSHFKRSIYGIYHFCTVKHLSRYCQETMYRYNLRKMKDAPRFTFSLQRVEGRLTYKDLVGTKPEIVPSIEKNKPIRKSKYSRRPIHQILNGEIVATFSSMAEAARQMGLNPTNIRSVLMGKLRTTGGYHWKYA